MGREKFWGRQGRPLKMNTFGIRFDLCAGSAHKSAALRSACTFPNSLYILWICLFQCQNLDACAVHAARTSSMTALMIKQIILFITYFSFCGFAVKLFLPDADITVPGNRQENRIPRFRRTFPNLTDSKTPWQLYNGALVPHRCSSLCHIHHRRHTI